MKTKLVTYLPLAFHFVEQCFLTMLHDETGMKSFRFDLNKLPPAESSMSPVSPTVEEPSSFSASASSRSVNTEPPFDFLGGGNDLSNTPQDVNESKGIFLDIKQKKRKSTYEGELASGCSKKAASDANSASGKSKTMVQILKNNTPQEIEDQSSRWTINSFNAHHPEDRNKNEGEPSHNGDKFYDLSDWQFFVMEPRSKFTVVSKRRVESADELFEFLRGMKSDGYVQGNRFSISRSKDVDFFAQFASKRFSEFNHADRFNQHSRAAWTVDILLRISDEKLNLENYLGFFTKIEDRIKSAIGLNDSLDERLQMSKQNSLEKRTEQLKKTTKVATVFIILYQSLFGDIEGGKLTEAHLLDLMGFFEWFWEQILSGVPIEKIDENRFEEKLCHAVNSPSGTEFHRNGMCSPRTRLAFARRMLEYWVKKSGKGNVINTVADPITKHRLQYRMLLSELINKIIFHLNYEPSPQ